MEDFNCRSRIDLSPQGPENLSCANDVPFHFSPFYVSSPFFFSLPSFPNYEFTPKSFSSSICLFYSNLSLKTKKKKLIEREKLSIIKNHLSKYGVVFMHSPRNRSKSLEENRRSPHRIMHIRRALMVECSPWKKWIQPKLPYREAGIGGGGRKRHFDKLVPVCGNVFKSSAAILSSPLLSSSQTRRATSLRKGEAAALRHQTDADFLLLERGMEREREGKREILLYFSKPHFVSLTAFISERFAHERIPLSISFHFTAAVSAVRKGM